MKRIGILGGTFDPIHHGHLALAKAAQKQFQLDKVLFVPAFIPPHKTEKTDITPAPYRYRMVEMAVLDEPDFEVSDIEFVRPEISYTADTLRRLKMMYPDADLFLILGEDSLAAISSWKEPEQIFKMAGILAAKRQGSSAPKAEKVNWIDMPECPLSSSRIRESLRSGKSKTGEFFPANVEQYIKKMKLYGTVA